MALAPSIVEIRVDSPYMRTRSGKGSVVPLSLGTPTFFLAAAWANLLTTKDGLGISCCHLRHEIAVARHARRDCNNRDYSYITTEIWR